MASSKYAYWAFAAAGPLVLYCLFVGLLMIPFVQRHTPDGESIYAWHVLPLPVYAKNEDLLIKQPSARTQDFVKTEAFKLLKDDPQSRLILYLHGNAGHITQGVRAASYHVLTDTSSYHIIAIDYRGFGHSTGSPTEQGLITDASALVDFAINVAGIPASRIVLLGQSLGTAITSGVAERYAATGVDFAGVVLVSGFSSMPTMLAGYAIAGYVPVLRPLKIIPPLLRWILGFIVDKWQSVDRLASLTKSVKERRGRLRLSLIHGANDWDIPCHESDRLFAAAANATVDGGLDPQDLIEMKDERTVWKGDKYFKATWTAEPDIVITHEQFPYGGE
ncbi:putative abhydrolase domain-containing protein [Phaeoacremonium minimum UCRPA7]|uniref:Putative abhydrolase domain-containing protein n=1 Tax=Phaeoacremonium minimum (strain UCR-PA7) TaxID=1286976 RepID=R8BCR7_PHAM7|nr:putative abhydrolase domain-containing protein [Phaeoacremonium minimum UCRPA7]EON97082.1 putative abhydrolase domain-containing protein [Phaeoacremonium minimum UCRPA7]